MTEGILIKEFEKRPMMGTAIDGFELLEAEWRLKFAGILEKAKADFLANISHDCRAPEDVCDCNCSKCNREWKIEYVPLSVIEKWFG